MNMRNRISAPWIAGLIVAVMALALWWQYRLTHLEPIASNNSGLTAAVGGKKVVDPKKIGPLLSQVPTSLRDFGTNAPRVAADPMFPYRLRNTKDSIEKLSRNNNAILLANALIDTTSKAKLEIPEHLKAKGDPGSYIVQARGKITDAFRQQLVNVGAEIVAYIPNNSYLVKVDANGAAQLARMGLTHSVLPYEPYYKLQEQLLPFAVAEAPVPLSYNLRLTFFPGEDIAATRQKVEALGSQIIAEDRSPFGPQLIVQAGNESLAALAGLSEIQTIERKGNRKFMNDLARVTVGISTVTTNNVTYRSLTGTNITLSINDSNVDTNHVALTGRVYVDPLYFSGIDTDGHGTHVAGTIAGDGSGSPTLSGTTFGSVPGALFTGMAPGAKLISQNIKSLPDALLAEFAYTNYTGLTLKTNTLISNNSWGYADSYEYDSASAIFDAATRDAVPTMPGSQPMLFVFSAGNSGFGDDSGLGGLQNSVSSTAAAKNVIAVGASENLRFITNEVTITDPILGTSNVVAYWRGVTDSSNQVASFSSRGNTGIGREGTYGRAKPDVIAPGGMTISAASPDMDLTNYYSVVTYTTNRFTNLVFSALQTNSFSLFVPANTTDFTIQILHNNSTNIVPNLDIYTNQNTALPSSNPLYFAGTNVYSTPIDSNGYGIWYYDVVNLNNSALNVEIREIIRQTNNLGNYPTVLSNMNNQLGPNYRFEVGTSMAAPVVSGTLALLQEFFESSLNITNASPALYKAMLINGARTLSETYGYEVKNTLNFQGWGLINISNTLPLLLTQATSGSSSPVQFFDQNPTNALATGESHLRNLTINPLAQPYPLRVTLVWTDPPGNPAAGIKLVNDLDLVVSNKVTHEVFYGNDFPSGNVYSVGNLSDTNAITDVVNNVENVYLPGDLSADYAIYVVANRVNVNAVQDHANGIVQDYALVVSAGNVLVPTPGAFVLDQTPTLISQPLPKIKYFTSSTNGLPLLGERVGANAPLITTTNGTNTQWNFYVFTNDSGFTNVTFVTFLPPNLSGNPNNNNYRSPSADIDLYVSTSTNLVILDPATVADCFNNTLYTSPLSGGAISAGRTGTEAIVIKNSPLNQVYYIGVKAEDQKGADFGFMAVATQDAPFGQDSNGRFYAQFLPVPAPIPDGNPELPAAVQVIAVVPQSIPIRRVVITNTLTHELFGDIVGSLEHNDIVVTLNNHTFFDANQQSGTFTTIYDDSDQQDITGARKTDGPGTLQAYLGTDAVGAWVFTMVDNSPQFVGQIDSMYLGIDQQTTNSTGGILVDAGSTVQLPPNASLFGAINVPPGVVAVTIHVGATTAGATTGVYVRKGALPDGATGLYDYSMQGDAGIGFDMTISLADVPPLTPGTYYVQIRNESGASATYNDIYYTFTYDLAATSGLINRDNTALALLDNALLRTNFNSLVVNNANNPLVAGVRVGVRIDHPRASDLVLRLLHVDSGISVLLAENRGGLVNTNGYGLGTNASDIVYSTFSEDSTLARQVIKFADPGNSFVSFVTPSIQASTILEDVQSLPKLRGSSGTDKEFTRYIPTGQPAGKIMVSYMFYTAKDQMDIYYEGTLLTNTVSATSTVPQTNNSFGNISLVDAATDTITTPAAHGLVNGDSVTLVAGTSLPQGINDRQRYYIINSTATTFQLALTAGGTAIDIVTAGSGPFGYYKWETVGPFDYSGTSDLIEVRMNGGVSASAGTLWDYELTILDTTGTSTVNNLQPRASQRITGLAYNNTNLFMIGYTPANGTNGIFARYTIPLSTNQAPAESVNWPDNAGGTRFHGITYNTNQVFVAGDSLARTKDTVGSKETKGIVVGFSEFALVTSGENLGSLWDTQLTNEVAELTEEMLAIGSGYFVTNDIVLGPILTSVIASAGYAETNTGVSRLKVARVDVNGNEIWKTMDPNSPDGVQTVGRGVAVLNGNVYVVGSSDETGVIRPFIASYDGSTGAELSRVILSGALPGQFNGVVAQGDYLYAVGSENATSGAAADFLAVKFDKALAEIWSSRFTLDLGDEDILYGVAAVGDRLYAVGSTIQPVTGKDGVIVELLQADGSLVTRTGYPGYVTYDDTFTKTGTSFAQDDVFRSAVFDGTELYVAGDVVQFGRTDADGILLRYHVKDDYYPEESLSNFIGDTANGTWRLEVDDTRAGNGTGTNAPQILSWKLQLYLSDTNPAAALLNNGVSYAGRLAKGRTNYFVINAPYTAATATHELTINSPTGTGTGLSLFFDQSTFPDGTYTILNSVTTTAQSVLTPLTSPQLIPGRRYYLAVYNPDATTTYNYNLKVTFDSTATTYLVGGQTKSGDFSSLPQSKQAYQFFIPPEDNGGVVQFLNLSSDVEVLLKLGSAPSTSSYDVKQVLSAGSKVSLPLAAGVTLPNVSGTWYMTVRQLAASDTTYQVRVMPPNHAPSLAEIGNYIIDEGTDLAIQLQGYDNDIEGNNLTYSLVSGVPSGMTINAQTGVITWRPSEAQGPNVYTVKARVTDDGVPSLYTEKNFTVTVNEVNSAPTLAGAGTFSASEGSLFTTTLHASDADLPANPLTFTLVSGPTGMTVSSSGVVSWTPGETFGGQFVSFTVRVSDNQSPALTASQTYLINVSEVNSAPVFGLVANQKIPELTAFQLDVVATDSDLPANILTYSLVGSVPTGMTINSSSGRISWTPTEAQGPGVYSITVQAKDNGVPSLTAQVTFSIEVEEVNLAPVMTSIPNQTINELQNWTYQVVATDADLPANTLTYSLTTAPTGMTISSTTGLISWTPTEAQGPGTYNVTALVTDNGTPSRGASRSFTVTVNDVNSAPVINPISDVSVDELTQLVVQVVASDSDLPAQTLSYKLTGTLPTGITINTSTGEIRWTPTEAQGPATYPITVEVSDGVLTASRTFNITVNEKNTAPVLGVIPDVSVVEGLPVRFVVTATDTDLPAQTLSYSLETGAPAGATINPTTGAFEWVTDEASPNNNVITVKVTDNGTPALSATRTFNITVIEVVTNVVDLVSGTAVTNTTRYAAGVVADIYHLNVATHPSKLLFELFNLSGNGDLLIRKGAYPTATQFDYSSSLAGTNREQVVVSTNATVTDLNGDYYATVINRETNNITYSISGTVPVTVDGGSMLTSTEGIKVAAPSLSTNTATAQFSWTAVSGEKYQVEVSTNLVDWSPLTTITVSGPTASFTDPTPYNDSQLRFYRIRQVPQ